MGYDGGIEFVHLPLGGIYWFPDSIKSSWSTGCSDTWYTGDGKEFVELKAWARPFAPNMVLEAEDEVELVFDGQDTAEWKGKDLMWVVAGREKKSSCDIVEMAHFILLIKRSEEWLESQEERTVCERVGVGRVIGKYLDLKSSPVAVVIR